MATPDENLILIKVGRVKDTITRLPFEDRAGAYSELADALIDRVRGTIEGEPLSWIEDDLDQLIDSYGLEL